MTNQTLRTTIAKLADDFADRLFDAVRSMSLEELMDSGYGTTRPTVGRSERSPAGGAPLVAPVSRRRSQEDIQAIADRVVQILRQHKEGLRTENLRAYLGLSREQIVRPIAYALETNRVTKKGEKRATTYFAR